MNIQLEGKELTVESGLTPLKILEAANSDARKTALAARLNGRVISLTTPVQEDGELAILDFSDEDGRKALRHTASHVLAQAVLKLRPNAKLAIGPAIDNGFYYDFDVEEPFTPDFLKEAETAERKFDLIILDPPSFTKTRKSVTDALRGYKEIHLRALKLLTPDGLLSTYCCSHHVNEREFHDVIADASVDAKRTLRVVSSHTQRRDHPVILTLPETAYLKGWTFQAVGGF
jgi:23S rRNA (cytosine1962-C5)-methyltransferase